MEKEATFKHNKVILAAIETVLEGSASLEETEHLAGVVVDFHQLETKRNRDRACEIRRRSQAFKDMNAVPFFGKAVYIDAAVLRGYDSRGYCTVRHGGKQHEVGQCTLDWEGLHCCGCRPRNTR